MSDGAALDGPLDHVVRNEPPWRAARLTECGRHVADVAAVITRDDLVAKVRRLGKQRAAFSTCMTCAERSRGVTWQADPVAIMRRDTAYGPAGHSQEVRLDLLALTALYEAHREEFDAHRARLAEGTDLERARRQRAAQRQRRR